MISADFSLSDRSESHLVPKLKELDQWICWRKDGDRKPPINPRSGRYIDGTDEKNWLSFDRAVECWHRIAGVRGIGFCLSRDDDITLVDIDSCVSGTSIQDDEAIDIVTTLSSYTELSPSGSGLHILVKGDIPTYGTSSKYSVELYDANKYFTYTGDHLSRLPIGILEREKEIKNIYNSYKPFSK